MADGLTPTWQTADGSVQLHLGDCLHILPQLEDGSVDMVWTDPPYGHGNQDGDLQSARVRDRVSGARVSAPEPIKNDAGGEFWNCLEGFFAATARVMNRDCCCCCCCCMAGGGPNPTFAKVSLLADKHHEFFQAVVWDKSARGNGMGWRYRRNYEFVLVTHRKGGRLLWADDSTAVPNVVRFIPPSRRVHPNEKPLEMVESFLAWHTFRGQTILDPFMGSGTTGVACVRTGRKFIGIEIEPKYFEIAVKRIEAELNRAPLFDPAPQVVQRSLLEDAS